MSYGGKYATGFCRHFEVEQAKIISPVDMPHDQPPGAILLLQCCIAGAVPGRMTKIMSVTGTGHVVDQTMK